MRIKAHFNENRDFRQKIDVRKGVFRENRQKPAASGLILNRSTNRYRNRRRLVRQFMSQKVLKSQKKSENPKKSMYAKAIFGGLHHFGQNGTYNQK